MLLFTICRQKYSSSTEFLHSRDRGRVNIQDFLHVFKGSGIGKMEDNLTSADPLSYSTNGSRVDLDDWGKRLLPLTLDSNPTASCGAPDHKH